MALLFLLIFPVGRGRLCILDLTIFDPFSLKLDSLISQKNCVIWFIEIPLKVMKYAFYFILKALFVLKIFKLLSCLLGHVEKTA